MKCIYYTERNNSENLQYERYFNLRENFMRVLHDFTCILLSLAVHDVESIAQDVEKKVTL